MKEGVIKVNEIISVLVYIGFSLFLLIGFILACLPFLHQLYNKMNIYNRYKLLQSSGKKTFRNNYYGRFLLLAETSYGISRKRNLYIILFFSIAIALSTALFLYQAGISILMIIFISIIFGAIPYFILLLRLQTIRSAGSNELEQLLIELISQYRINHCNMYEAIDQTIPRLTKSPHSQKALLKLSLAIKQADSDAEIIDSVNNFNYALKTNLSEILSENLKYSLVYGENIFQALEDILEESKTMNSIYEKDRQQNNEALFMIKYVTPAVYLISVYAMVGVIGLGFSKYIEYQFFNSLGLKFFLLILIFMVINSGIYVFLKKEKRDF